MLFNLASHFCLSAVEGFVVQLGLGIVVVDDKLELDPGFGEALFEGEMDGVLVGGADLAREEDGGGWL